jgi:hypothetical protein
MARGRRKKGRSTAPRKAWWLLALALLPLLLAVDWSAQHRDIGEWWRAETAKQSDTAAPAVAQDVAVAQHAVVYPQLTAGGVTDTESFMQLGPHGLPADSSPAASGTGTPSQAQSDHASDAGSYHGGDDRHRDGHGDGRSSAGLPAPGIAFLPSAGGGSNQSSPSHPAQSSTPDSTTPPGTGAAPGSGAAPGDSGAPGSSTGPGDSVPPSGDGSVLPVNGTQPITPPTKVNDPVNTVPEPGTLWLLVLAAALLSVRKGFFGVARMRT